MSKIKVAELVLHLLISFFWFEEVMIRERKENEPILILINFRIFKQNSKMPVHAENLSKYFVIFQAVEG